MAKQSWLDSDGTTTVIDDRAKKLEGFMEAMADGQIDGDELAAQEQRVVALMKEIEPQVDDPLHAKLTDLMCELSAFNFMQLLNQLYEARLAASQTKFQG